MLTVGQLLDGKGRQVWSVQVDSTVFEALRVMAHKDIGALLILDGESVVGILSERDYARKIALEGRASRYTPVTDIMSRQVLSVSPRHTVHECMALMTAHKVRHLRVLEQGRVLGIISIGDLVKSIIAEQEFVIEQMTHYIAGTMA
ncbi:MAG: CBS domain-containing protein [Proteobacteria bacterium]|nr:CBS domain-containing protein [Pseudomonadota bacterium]